MLSPTTGTLIYEACDTYATDRWFCYARSWYATNANSCIQPPMQAADMPQGPSNPTMVNSQVKNSAAASPEMIARIRAGIEAGLESGEITTQELNMVVRLARTVIQNPDMYPQMRQLAIQRGIATEQDLPVQYDEGFIMAILMIGEALEADVQFNPPQTDMPEGGMLRALILKAVFLLKQVAVLEMEAESLLYLRMVQKKAQSF